MTVSSQVTDRPGDLRWKTYKKWPGADDCDLSFVLEDIGDFGYGDNNGEAEWYCLPKYVGLEVERTAWLKMGNDPEEIVLRTALKDVSLRVFQEECNNFWNQKKKPPPGKVISIFQDLSEEDSYQFWEIIRVDKEWQAALEQIRPSKGLRDHFRELFSS